MLTFTFLDSAAATSQQTQGGGMGSMLLMIGALFLVMYFFMIRPQQKKQKQLREMRNQLQKGDKVITAGGIYGTIHEIKDNYVLLEVDNNVKIRVDRSTIYKDNSDLQQR
ncbi:MAG: preprotein translocase subunit YajC [Prevotellaceae bacterium]|jgi:preprotein translocase subunit YajC|nr:preprotein translocase subunit YajC [Prevotellaceae bacterium]